jgi:hypothetical protein
VGRGNEGKTAFVKEFLQSDPQATPRIVNDAWKAAGKKGTISKSLVKKSRAALRQAGNRSVRPAPKPSTANAPAARTVAPPSLALHARERLEANSPELEAEIDRVLFKVIEEGGMSDVEEALRAARRRVILSNSR